MTFQEKKSLIFFFTTIVIFAYFWFRVFSGHPGSDVSGAVLLNFWCKTILWWIGIQILANILTHIVLSILNTIVTQEKEPSIKDERDRLFDLRVDRNSSTVFSIGFFLSMFPPAFGLSVVMMFYVLVFSLFIAQLIGSATEFMSYRRGF